MGEETTATTVAGATKTLEELSQDLVTKAIESRTTAIDQAKEELQTEIDKKIDTDKLWKGDVFDTTYTHANGSYAHLWNEKDGGGVQFFNSVSKVKSFVGVNDANGKNNGDITVQLYSVDNTDKVGTRININQLGAYYLKGTTNVGTPEDRELAVKGDITTVATQVTDLKADVKDKYVTKEQAAGTYAKADEVYTKAEVDELVANTVNAAIAAVLEQLANDFSNE